MGQRFVYVVDYWVDFPSSKYGGLQVLIAASDDEVFQYIADDSFESHKKGDWQQEIKECIERATKIPVAETDSTPSGFIAEFVT
jgi:hypothetical protein